MDSTEGLFVGDDYGGVALPVDMCPAAPNALAARQLTYASRQFTFFPGGQLAGHFSGQFIRVELQELQKANIGRKYGSVDRRPIDPPPVVALRLFCVHNAGTSAEFEQEVCDYEGTAGPGLGLICMVDMFEVPGSGLDSDVTRSFSASGLTPSTYNHGLEVGLGSAYEAAYAVQLGQVELSPIQNFNLPASGRSYAGADIGTGIATGPRSSDSDSESVLHYHMGVYPIKESSNATQAIVGEKFVEPVTVNYRGRKVLMFAFPDIAVKQLGCYILRYRVFDVSLFMHPGASSLLGELYGGAFRVHSTRECPSLGPSTELTELLAEQCPDAIRVTIRRQTRESRKTRSASGDDGSGAR